MSTSTATTITPEQVRVGQRIRVTKTWPNGDETAVASAVAKVTPMTMGQSVYVEFASDYVSTMALDAEHTITLLREAPTYQVGGLYWHAIADEKPRLLVSVGDDGHGGTVWASPADTTDTTPCRPDCVITRAVTAMPGQVVLPVSVLDAVESLEEAAKRVEENEGEVGLAVRLHRLARTLKDQGWQR